MSKQVSKQKEQVKEIFDKLSDKNKEIITMVAKGMEVAQNENHIPHLD